MQLSKIIIAPDSFKGNLTANRAAEIIAAEIGKKLPACNIVTMPIADGGEGSVDAILSAIGGEIFAVRVRSPDDRRIEAVYGIAYNATAIIEMAQSSGITRQIGLHPMTSTTFGFGQLVLAALKRGARDFILCIGGSATTDGGCGMAAALGVRFTDRHGESLVPCGETLCDIIEIDTDELDPRIAKSRFTVMCDVDNPLYGLNGAAHVYAPQKGADPEQVLVLDRGLRHYGSLLEEKFGGLPEEQCGSLPEEQCGSHPEEKFGKEQFGKEQFAKEQLDKEQPGKEPSNRAQFAEIPGAGAAGGLGAGCMAFLGANLMSGIDTILKLCQFEKHKVDAGLIITGEGKLDSQSFQGKVLSGLLQRANGIPVWSICGICDCDVAVLKKHDLKVFEMSEGITVEESMREPEKYLRAAARRAMESVK